MVSMGTCDRSPRPDLGALRIPLRPAHPRPELCTGATQTTTKTMDDQEMLCLLYEHLEGLLLNGPQLGLKKLAQPGGRHRPEARSSKRWKGGAKAGNSSGSGRTRCSAYKCVPHPATSWRLAWPAYFKKHRAADTERPFGPLPPGQPRPGPGTTEPL